MMDAERTRTRKETQMQTRYRGQHGRAAFGPHRKRTKQALARNIASSIRQHAQRGWHRQVSEYTLDGETQQLVTALLQQAA
jgi:hypothetical protein